MKRSRKRTIGACFWLCACAGIALLLGSSHSDRPAIEKAAGEVARYVSQRGETISLEDSVGRLRLGDPVFLANEFGQYRQVGHISESTSDAGITSVLWYESDIRASECQMFQHHSSGRLSEVVETLMPPEKRKRIRDRMAIAMAEHGEELTNSFIPLVRETLEKSLPVIEDEFRESVARHRGEINSAAERWNDEIVEKRLIPLAREEILPIVKEHGEEPAEEIGQEIWNRASLWRFGWRALYDKTPLPKKDLVQEEWKRFVKEEAMPVVESHMDEIVEAIQKSVQDIAANQAIRRELGAVTDDIVSDPESRRLIQVILKETFVDNDRLQAVWNKVWSSRDAEAAFEVAGTRLEPVVRSIGDEIFGSEEDGIDPSFARVLRSQILRKDRRWVVAWHTGANSGSIALASKPTPFPIVYLAEEME